MSENDFTLPIRRWWWLLLITALLAAVCSLWAVRHRPQVYEATTSLVVGRALQNPNPSAPDLELPQQVAGIYADYAQRDPVKEAVQHKLGLANLPHYTVTSVPGTQFLEVSVTDVVPARAQAVANAIAGALIGLSPTDPNAYTPQQQAFQQQEMDSLASQIKDAKSALAQTQAQLQVPQTPAQLADTQARVTALQNRLGQLQDDYTTLIANTHLGAINTLAVVDPATLPRQPMGPKPVLIVLLAAIAGLLLATGAAYLLELFDDTLKNPFQVDRWLHLPTLTAIPAARAFRRGDLVMRDSRRSDVTEPFRVLRTHLESIAAGQPLKVLLVTSACAGEGKTVTAANLSIALAQAGNRVALVDADLGRPRLHALFGLANVRGLTDLLTGGEMNPGKTLQPTTVPGLAVLSAGSVVENAAELLASPRMGELLGSLRNSADVVVLDTAPAGVLADAATLSLRADGVLLVVDTLKTRRTEVQRALAALQQVNAHIVGVVLNRMPRNRGAYDYYYHFDRKYASQAQTEARTA